MTPRPATDRALVFKVVTATVAAVLVPLLLAVVPFLVRMHADLAVVSERVQQIVQRLDVHAEEHLRITTRLNDHHERIVRLESKQQKE